MPTSAEAPIPTVPMRGKTSECSIHTCRMRFAYSVGRAKHQTEVSSTWDLEIQGIARLIDAGARMTVPSDRHLEPRSAQSSRRQRNPGSF